jgi:hypothetical protein
MKKKTNSNGKPNQKSIKWPDKKRNSKPLKSFLNNHSKISRKPMALFRIKSFKCKRPKNNTNNKLQLSQTNKKPTVFSEKNNNRNGNKNKKKKRFFSIDPNSWKNLEKNQRMTKMTMISHCYKKTSLLKT